MSNDGPQLPAFRYYLNLGSNMGCSRQYLEAATEAVFKLTSGGVQSREFESEPWGFSSTSRFVNLALAVDSTLTPMEMLKALQDVERKISEVAHRNPDGSYKDREIDIDIMAVWDINGEINIDTPDLTVPHKHLEERDFFTTPLQELHSLRHIMLRRGPKGPEVLLTSGNVLPLLKETAGLGSSVWFEIAPGYVGSQFSGSLDENELERRHQRWVGLRESWKYIGDMEWSLAAKGAELTEWERQNRFCGVCGAPMERVGNIEKRCPECGYDRFPKLSPCVLVLVEKDDMALLIHDRNMFKGMHALVAGFVETGETLEECVKREVREETGLEITGIEYFGSQSWPFPGQLMTAFRARWESGNLKWADGEVTAGNFYSREEVSRMLATASPETFRLPTLPSLSRRLIDFWLHRK